MNKEIANIFIFHLQLILMRMKKIWKMCYVYLCFEFVFVGGSCAFKTGF